RAEPSHAPARPAARGSQARRPRPGLRQGPLLRPRDQGPEVALGLAHDARRLRGRPDADLHAHPEGARRDLEGRDADRPVPHVHAAGQPEGARGALRRGRRGHPRGARREGPDQEHEEGRQDPRQRRADEEAVRHRARLLEDCAREDRGRRRQRHVAARRAGREEAEAQAEDEAGHDRGAGDRGCRTRARGRRRGRARGRGVTVLSWLTNAWRVPELRRRVLFTAAILAVYRFGSFLPAPGVDSKSIENYFNGGSRANGIFGLLNVFSGSALSRFSVFALGIMPYVTASIILQLMTVVIPRLEQLQKEGEAGYAKINQYTRYLTVVLAAAQSTGYAFLFRREGVLNANAGRLVLIILTLTAGTVLLMYLGELITKRGIGNGISLLIFASILATAAVGVVAW